MIRSKDEILTCSGCKQSFEECVCTDEQEGYKAPEKVAEWWPRPNQKVGWLNGVPQKPSPRPRFGKWVSTPGSEI